MLLADAIRTHTRNVRSTITLPPKPNVNNKYCNDFRLRGSAGRLVADDPSLQNLSRIRTRFATTRRRGVHSRTGPEDLTGRSVCRIRLRRTARRSPVCARRPADAHTAAPTRCRAHPNTPARHTRGCTASGWLKKAGRFESRLRARETRRSPRGQCRDRRSFVARSSPKTSPVLDCQSRRRGPLDIQVGDVIPLPPTCRTCARLNS